MAGKLLWVHPYWLDLESHNCLKFIEATLHSNWPSEPVGTTLLATPTISTNRVALEGLGAILVLSSLSPAMPVTFSCLVNMNCWLHLNYTDVLHYSQLCFESVVPVTQTPTKTNMNLCRTGLPLCERTLPSGQGSERENDSAQVACAAES